jgi:hypothetical protein
MLRSSKRRGGRMTGIYQLWWRCNDCDALFVIIEAEGETEPNQGYACYECGKRNCCWERCCVGDLNAR